MNLFTVNWANTELSGQIGRLRFGSRLEGGFGSAYFTVTGPLDLLRMLLISGLRKDFRDVIITDRQGATVFEGFATTVRFRVGPVSLSHSLVTMANAVAVMYTRTSDGAQVITPWQEDADSIAVYGRKEYIESASGSLTDALALQLAKTILNLRRYPKVELRLELSGSPGENVLEVEAVGYWALAQWYYYMSTDQSQADSGTVIWERAQTTGVYTAGTIRTTGVQVPRAQTDRAVTIQDAVMRLAKLGDSNFDPVFPQVWENKRFDLLRVQDLPIIYLDASTGQTYSAPPAFGTAAPGDLSPWLVRPGYFDVSSITVYTSADVGVYSPTRILISETQYDAVTGRLSLVPAEATTLDVVLARIGVV